MDWNGKYLDNQSTPKLKSRKNYKIFSRVMKEVNKS